MSMTKRGHGPGRARVAVIGPWLVSAWTSRVAGRRASGRSSGQLTLSPVSRLKPELGLVCAAPQIWQRLDLTPAGFFRARLHAWKGFFRQAASDPQHENKQREENERWPHENSSAVSEPRTLTHLRLFLKGVARKETGGLSEK